MKRTLDALMRERSEDTRAQVCKEFPSDLSVGINPHDSVRIHLSSFCKGLDRVLARKRPPDEEEDVREYAEVDEIGQRLQRDTGLSRTGTQRSHSIKPQISCLSLYSEATQLNHQPSSLIPPASTRAPAH